MDTLIEAATFYAATFNLDGEEKKQAINDFKEGAKWQKEQDKVLLQEAQEIINVFIGNTKSGDYRNYLTDVNIKLLTHLKDLSK